MHKEYISYHNPVGRSYHGSGASSSSPYYDFKQLRPCGIKRHQRTPAVLKFKKKLPGCRTTYIA